EGIELHNERDKHDDERRRQTRAEPLVSFGAFLQFTANRDLVATRQAELLQAGPDVIEKLIRSQRGAPPRNDKRSLLVLATDTRKIETGSQARNLVEGYKLSVVSERSAG